jgi:hypothetical protein
MPKPYRPRAPIYCSLFALASVIALWGTFLFAPPNVRAATIQIAATLSETPFASASLTFTETGTPTETPSEFPTATPEATESVTSNFETTPTLESKTPTPSHTPPTLVATESHTPEPTATNPMPTATPGDDTPTATATITPDETHVPTATFPPTETLMPTPTGPSAPGILRGRVALQGREDAIGVTIHADDDTEIATIESKRAFSIELAPGVWTLEFRRAGYLRQQQEVVIESNVTTQLPNITLYGGDVNQDGIIDAADADQIANHFGATDDASTASDVNGDGEINILDLALTCANFGRSAQTE